MSAAAALPPPPAYTELCSKLKIISTLNGVSSLLGWDELVFMPPGAAAIRAEQSLVLAGLEFDKSTEPALGALLAQCQQSSVLNLLGPYQRANIREAARDYKRVTSLPKSLIERCAALSSESYHVWVQARKTSNFALFAPKLTEWIDISREKARLIDPSRDAYDVLLDEFEKGATTKRLDELFNIVKAGIVPLLKRVREAAAAEQVKGVAPRDSWLVGEFDLDKQAELCKELAIAIGFDTDRGRLDVSVHPFTGGPHPNDVRMTTRFKAGDVVEGISGAIHETGHSLYEQGRPADYDGLPVSKALSMGVHESQSLLWERAVGLSLPFCKYLLPKLRKAFPLPTHSPEDLYRALNVVRAESFIRVESDELAYPLHIIIRYELERALIAGTLEVKDLPRAWSEKYATYLGCTPKDDAQGVLQDVHWSSGSFGYFPTYTLGAMSAVQIYQTAEASLPGLEEDIAAGQFGRLKSWLNEKVHALGSMPEDGDALMIACTGKPLDPEIFLSHMRRKYGGLYA